MGNARVSVGLLLFLLVFMSFALLALGPVAGRLHCRGGNFTGLGSASALDSNLAHLIFQSWATQLDIEQAVVEIGTGYINAFGQHKAALKLPGSDAAMQENAPRIILLTATNREL